LFCVLAVLLLAAHSVAQSSDRVEVFGGYAYMAPAFISTAPSGGSGWHVSATVNVARHVGIVADFSGFAPTGPACTCGAAFGSYHTFMGGPQASIRMGKIKPFVQFLMGRTLGRFTRADAQFGGDFSLFTIGAGGGVDVGINRWIAVRGQADWLHMGSPFSSNTARTSVGLVFRF
jgi:hypothetical protein